MPVRKINICTRNNGVGLLTDTKILMEKLDRYECRFVSIDGDGPEPQKADLNIHLELLRPHLYKLAPLNYFIPNPEWFLGEFRNALRGIDKVLVKTNDAHMIFRSLHRNVEHIGFTSPDMMNEKVERTKMFLHVAGNSSMKNTEAVLTAFKHTGYPLTLITRKPEWMKQPANIQVISEYITDLEVKSLMNEHIIHLCPSQYEGWGHYLHEAKSCAVVLTTDSQPMCEFIKDKRFLLKPDRFRRHMYVRLAIVGNYAMIEAIKWLNQLDEAELTGIIRQNRREFLENDKKFEKRINEIISKI